MHRSKSFRRNKAVDGVTFGVEAREVFAGLDPDMADKIKQTSSTL